MTENLLSLSATGIELIHAETEVVLAAFVLPITNQLCVGAWLSKENWHWVTFPSSNPGAAVKRISKDFTLGEEWSKVAKIYLTQVMFLELKRKDLLR